MSRLREVCCLTGSIGHVVTPLPEDTLLEVKVINGLISSKNNVDQTISMQTEEVTLLEGHQMGVFCCQWNPENPSILATAYEQLNY